MSELAQISDKDNLKRFSPSDHAACDLAVKRAAALDLKECRLSREAVCMELSRLLEREITVAQIDALVAESKTHRLPMSIIPAWITVTGSTRLLALLCGAAGMWLADETEHRFAELGRAGLRAEKLAARTAELKEALWDKV